jgi:hypothetical protein
MIKGECLFIMDGGHPRQKLEENQFKVEEMRFAFIEATGVEAVCQVLFVKLWLHSN